MSAERAIAPRFSGFIAQAAHLSGAQVIVTFISLGYFAIAARKLGPELMSIIAIYDITASLSAAMSSFGLLDIALLRSSNLFARGERPAAIALFVKAALVSTVPYVLAAVAAAIIPLGQHPFLEHNLGRNWPQLLIWSCYFYKLTEISSTWLMASQRCAVLAAVRVAGSIVPRVTGLFVGLLWGPVPMLLAHLATSAISAVFAGIALRADLRGIDWRIALREPFCERKVIGRDGLTYFLNTMTRTCSAQLDIAVVGWLFPQRILGGYFVCRRAFDLISQYSTTVLAPCIPMIAGAESYAVAKKTVRQVARVIALLATTGMLAAVALNYGILSVLAGPQFKGYEGLLLGFWYLGWLYWFQSFFLSVLYATLSPGSFCRFSVSSAAVTLAVSAVLGLVFGVVGFVVGRLFSSLALIAWGAYLTFQNKKVDRPEMFFLMRVLTGVAVLAALAYLGRPVLSPRHLVCCLAGALVCFFTLGQTLKDSIAMIFTPNQPIVEREIARISS
jgi:O-antigen/teichoic acid export membrane protein